MFTPTNRKNICQPVLCQLVHGTNLQVPTDVPEMACDVDFFTYDNEELLRSRPTDNLLKDVVYRGHH